jgi:hypothetical protein
MLSEEKRASKRLNCEAPVIIENCQTGEYYDGSMYNYSQEGMYVELDSFLKPGCDICIVVEKGKNSSHSECRRARIIWCREIVGAVVLYNYGAGVQYDSTAKTADCRNIFKVIEGGASRNRL